MLWFVWKVNDRWRFLWLDIFIPTTRFNAGIFCHRSRVFTIDPDNMALKTNKWGGGEKNQNITFESSWVTDQACTFLYHAPRVCSARAPAPFRACRCALMAAWLFQLSIGGCVYSLNLQFSGSASKGRWLMDTWPPVTLAHPSQQVTKPRGLMGNEGDSSGNLEQGIWMLRKAEQHYPILVWYDLTADGYCQHFPLLSLFIMLLQSFNSSDQPKKRKKNNCFSCFLHRNNPTTPAVPCTID